MSYQVPLPRVGWIPTAVVVVLLTAQFGGGFSPLPAGRAEILTLTNSSSYVPLTAAPANDNFSNAEPLLGVSGVVLGTNVGATKESFETTHANVPASASVWYKWQAPSNGRFVFTTAGSNFNTVLAVYTGANPPLSEKASNDDDPSLCPIASFPTLSKVGFDAVGGVVYHIAVDGASGGNITLRWGRSATINVRPRTVSSTGPSGALGTNLDGDICSVNFSGFTFNDIPTGGNYTVSIRKDPGYSYTPDSQNPSTSPLTGDVTLIYYLRTPAYAITGRVTNLPPTDMNGVSVTCVSINGGLVSIPANVAINGSFVTFECPGLPAFATYLVTPSKLGYALDPASKNIELFGNIDYGPITATPASYPITGRVTLTNSLTGVSGVSVALSGSQTQSIVTDTIGNYSFTVLHGGTYTVTPSHPNFTFTPPNRSFTNVTALQTGDFAANFLLQLIMEESGQAAALDSVLYTRDPFPVIDSANLLNQGVDRNTRVAIFVTNFQLGPGESPSSVVINLVGSNNQPYDIPAEDVRPTSNPAFTQIIFRLPNTLTPGTCTLLVKARGLSSNIGAMRIRS